MGGLSFWHLLILVAIVLLFFGPSRLPGLGKSVGEAIRGLKKGLDGSEDIDVTNSAKREQIREQDGQNANSQSTKDKNKV